MSKFTIKAYQICFTHTDEDLIDATVRVGNIQCGSPISAKQAGPGIWIDVICDEPICGTGILIHSGLGDRALTLCEVMVYGHRQSRFIYSLSLLNCQQCYHCVSNNACFLGVNFLVLNHSLFRYYKNYIKMNKRRYIM